MSIQKRSLLTLMALFFGTMLSAQVTTGSLTGKVTGEDKKGLAGATIEAVHEPSGTRYHTQTQTDGSFTIPGMRVGGPYTVSVSFVGKKAETFSDLTLQLGTPLVLDAKMIDANTALQEVTVAAAGKKNARLISTDRKGTATNISRRTLESLPTLSRSLTDFTKLTPQSNGTSFGGMDNRFNNLTIDGSIFNNSFGLQALPGSQTNSTPISLDALEEIQINLSPYNVREAGFTGAGINAITRSGTNTFHASVFYNQRNEGYVGKNAGKTGITVADFDVKQFGFRLGGPIIKNKLFFFINAEGERRTDPGNAFLADNGDGTAQNNETRVKATDLNALSSFMASKFGYTTGPYEGYSFETFSNKAIAKIDWNINDVHKFSFRFNYLKSHRDVPVSNSGGFNNRRDNLFAITFQNSNYIINNDIYSAIAELNSNFSSKMSNNIIFGFTANRDYRSSNSTPFPLIDILEGGRNYMTLGYEPFTPNNILNTDTWQFQDNLTFYKKKHTYSTGVNFESFKFFNSFTPTLYGQYAFKSLADFYTSANAFIANPNLTTNPVQLQAYNLTYSAQPGGALWAATTKAYSIGAYVQDEFSPFKDVNLTYGARMDVPFFKETGIQNDSVSSYVFRDEQGKYIPLSTRRLPGAKPLFNPRGGFNWDVNGKKKTQIRGGLGLYSGRPAFVWISNQMGNNGVQSGSIAATNTTAFAFNTDPKRWIPTTITTPAPSYNIAVTDKDFKFPQIFRTNIAVDQQLPWNMVFSVEYLYSKFVNNVNYVNANVKEATAHFAGPDQRPKFGGYGLSGAAANNANRINPKISDATVLKNTEAGYTHNLSVKLERPFRKNFSWMMAYNRGYAKDLISAGSIAFSSWSQNFSVNGNNHPDLAFSTNDLSNRFIASASYRFEWVNKKAATTITMFLESKEQGRYSYIYTGDFNGDQISGNDLIYIPNNSSELIFLPFTSGATTFTAQQQADAFWSFVKNDPYLGKHTGEYAQRNGGRMPKLNRIDLSVAQTIKLPKWGGLDHVLELRMDVFNFGNMFSRSSGISDVVNTNALLTPKGVNGAGVPQFNMNLINGSLNYGTFRKSAALGDVWQMQLGARYSF